MVMPAKVTQTVNIGRRPAPSFDGGCKIVHPNRIYLCPPKLWRDHRNEMVRAFPLGRNAGPRTWRNQRSLQELTRQHDPDPTLSSRFRSILTNLNPRRLARLKRDMERSLSFTSISQYSPKHIDDSSERFFSAGCLSIARSFADQLGSYSSFVRTVAPSIRAFTWRFRKRSSFTAYGIQFASAAVLFVVLIGGVTLTLVHGKDKDAADGDLAGIDIRDFAGTLVTIDLPKLHIDTSRPVFQPVKVQLPDKGDAEADALNFAVADWTGATMFSSLTEKSLDITSKDSYWTEAGKTWGVDPLLIYSVALVESRALQPDGNIAPTPWVARINQRLVMGGKDRVVDALTMARNFSVPVQDVGIMQVYYPMHMDLESNPIALVEPRHNIMIGTQILVDAMRQTRDPVLGVGYYHSHNAVLARYYGRAVLTVYHRLQGLLGQGPAIRVASAR